MSIDSNLQKIENAIKDQDLLEAFNEIKETRNNYPYNNRVNKLIEKYKIEFQKKFVIKSKEIIRIYHNNKPQLAISKLEKLLEKEPNNPLVNATIGNLQGIQGNFLKAKIFHEKGVLFNPFEDMFYLNLSQTLNQLGEYKRSLRIILFAEIINPVSDEIKTALARAYYNVKDLEKAYLVYEDLIKKNKNDTNLKLEFCFKLFSIKDTKKITKILKTIKNNFRLKDRVILSGLVKFNEKKIDEAIKIFSEALEFDCDNSTIYSFLALCYEANFNYCKAKSLHEKALKMKPNNLIALKNFADHYYFIGEIDNAEKLYLKILELNKYHADCRYSLSLVQLYKNNFKDGWKNFKFRWLSPSFNTKERKLNFPYFKNQKEQKKALIWSEQGLGDQVLYSRFFNNLNTDQEIYSLVSPKLFNLFRRSFPNIKFIENINSYKIECHLAMGDLCEFFVNDIDDIKKNCLPYLIINHEITNKIRNKLPAKKSICGISWISKNEDIGKNKSLELEHLKKILLLPNYVFIDLQYGNTDKERNDFFDKYGVKIFKFNEIDNFNDIDGLLSLISICDLVLSVSNTTVHLAGGIGKKTYLMLPKGKGQLWYWSKEKDNSIWYKSVKIFQQDIPNTWDKVINNIYELMR